jgi:glycosyltransferase involved in cell wall biosynthesis
MIFCCYYTHKRGGLCKRLYRLLNALVESGEEVRYFSLDSTPSGVLSSKVKIELIPFPMRIRKGLLFWAFFLPYAALYLGVKAYHSHPKKIIAFNPFYALLFLPTKWISQAQLILFVRSLVHKINKINRLSSFLLWVSNQIDKLGLKNADKIVAMTYAMAKELKNFAKLKHEIAVLPNEVSYSIDAPKRESSIKKLVVLTAGIFDRRKNTSFLLEVWQKVETALGEDACQLLLAGDGAEIENLKKRAKELNLHTIHFCGWQEHGIDHLLDQSTLLMHPSLHEGVPNVVIEALARGCPVLASDQEEMRELLDDEALLFSLTDSERLSQRLIALVNQEKLYSQLLEASQKASKKLNFDWEKRVLEIIC